MTDQNKTAVMDPPVPENPSPDPQINQSSDVTGPPLCQVPEPKAGETEWKPCGLNAIADLRIDLFGCPLLAPMHVCAGHLLKIKMGTAVNMIVAPVPGIVIASDFDLKLANGNGQGKIVLG